MRTHEEAHNIAKSTHEMASRTGLRKMCPRCHRGGWVFVEDKSAIIVWDGEARGYKTGGAPVDTDLCDKDGLFVKTFGCGYDPE